VERARVLAFVVDLGAGDAVEALKGLWKEVGLYESMKVQEEKDKSEMIVQWTPFTSVEDALANRSETIVVNSRPNFDAPLTPQIPSIAIKPWFVVATKADLPGTKENFENLKLYVKKVSEGDEKHPSGRDEHWQKKVEVIPISAINGHGVGKITEWTVGLLDE
jgi:GTP-binding protein